MWVIPILVFLAFLLFSSSEAKSMENQPPNQEIDTIGHFIRNNEGLRLHAYWDVRRWSIGYGTIGHEGEVITAEEAYNRMVAYLCNDYNRFIREWQGYDTNMKTAMLDFAYQYGYGGMRSRFGAYLTAHNREAIKNKLLSMNDYYTRRQKEAALL